MGSLFDARDNYTFLCCRWEHRVSCWTRVVSRGDTVRWADKQRVLNQCTRWRRFISWLESADSRLVIDSASLVTLLNQSGLCHSFFGNSRSSPVFAPINRYFVDVCSRSVDYWTWQHNTVPPVTALNVSGKDHINFERLSIAAYRPIDDL